MNSFLHTSLVFLLPFCSTYYRGPISDHFNGTYFYDPYERESLRGKKHGTIWDILKWKITSKRKAWPKRIENVIFDYPPDRVFGNELRIAYVGHATFLIQTQGLNILTDPVWSERVSPVNFVGPKRVIEPGIVFDSLPAIDIVLISHNHYDHLDLITLNKLWQRHQPRIIAPLGNDTIIRAYNSAIQVTVCDWYDQIPINEHMIVHITPTHHWSARGIFDKNKALWGAFVLTTSGGNLYFTGDSGYGNGQYFKAARKKFGMFRLAILPIGAYEPRWFMQYAHMSPEDAVKAHIDLGCPYTVPMHYDVFRLADEGYGQPLRDLEVAKNKYHTQEKIHTLGVGEYWMVPE